MKRQIFILWAAVSSLLLFTSCEKQNDNSLFWGQTRHYTDFLFKKYEPVRMEQTLVFEFNEDALKRWNDAIVFELIDINTKKRIDDVILYKNGEACANNLLKITTSDNEVVVGIEFKPTAPEGSYMLALQPNGLNGLDRIEALELDQGIVIEKMDVMNPLAKGTSIGLITILTVLVIWILIARLVVHPSTCFTRVGFDYGSGEGRPIRMDSAYKLVCTNKAKKVSFFHKLFIGDIKYEVNDFWDKDFTITNGVKHRHVRFEGRANYTISSDTVVKGDNFTVTNSNGQEVRIQL